uniref:Uncharacterized protein n=1 Tax=Onchocerca volvulus TaxID=6282 RepID=A0A8R1TSA5_ONCVO
MVDSRLESSFEQLKPSESEQQRNEKLVDSRLELSFVQLKPSEYEQQRKEKLVPTADVEDELDDDKI